MIEFLENNTFDALINLKVYVTNRFNFQTDIFSDSL